MIAIVLIGPTGSGKTTIAHGVCDRLNITHISSGEIARRIAQADHYARAGLAQGEWAPELAIRTEVQAQIEAAVATTGEFVIDGFPRKVEQLYILESVPGIRPIYCYVDCDPLTCIRRLVRRGREGDNPDAVATRMKAYREHTEPMIDMLHSHLVELDGTLEPALLVELVTDEFFREASNVTA